MPPIIAVQHDIRLAPDLHFQLAKRADKEGLALQPFVHLLLQRALKEPEPKPEAERKPKRSRRWLGRPTKNRKCPTCGRAPLVVSVEGAVRRVQGARKGGRAAWAGLTPDERSDRMRKGWATRRANAENRKPARDPASGPDAGLAHLPPPARLPSA